MTMTSQAYAHLSDHSYGRDEKGNPVELDIFTGYMTAIGKKLGIPVPQHEKVHAALLDKSR